MKRYISAICLLALTIGASAQEKTMTLQQCVDQALRHSYDIQAADKAVERSRALQGTAWDVDKTELSLSQDPTAGGSPDNALSLSQSIAFPTYYIARHGQLKAETSAMESKRDMTRNELTGKVYAAYYQLVYEQERLRILAHKDSILARYHALADKHYQAGETRQLEVLTAERLLRENHLERASQQAQADVCRLQLAQLLNMDANILPADNRLSAIEATLPAFSYEQTADARYAAAQTATAEKALSVAKNGYAPSLSLSLRRQMVITSWDPYHLDRQKFDGGNFMGFEVGVGVPLFFGATKAKVRAAQKERELAQIAAAQDRREKETAYRAALNSYNAAYARLSYYTDEGQQKAAELMRLATLEYEQGEIGYIEYIQALQESTDVSMKHASAINDYNQSVIALKSLSGVF